MVRTFDDVMPRGFSYDSIFSNVRLGDTFEFDVSSYDIEGNHKSNTTNQAPVYSDAAIEGLKKETDVFQPI